MQLIISTAFLSVLCPQTNLDILVIIVVHRAKVWVKLLVIPSTLYIISSGTMRDIQQGGSILARTASIVLWPVYDVLSHRILPSSSREQPVNSKHLHCFGESLKHPKQLKMGTPHLALGFLFDNCLQFGMYTV